MTRKTVIIFVVLITFCLNNYVKATENGDEMNKNFFKDLSKKIQDPIKQVFDLFNGNKNDDKVNDRVNRPYSLVAIEEEFDKLFGRHKETNNKEEHGRLDFIGRDVLRNLKSEFDNFSNKVLKKVETEGLDTNKTFFTGVKEQFQNRIRAIVPGTKWCGDGDIAKNNDDLGIFSDIDRCCREHDRCSMSIAAGQSKYGLKNTGLFTRSSCECDGNFYNCLKTANNIISNEIGFTYFTVLGPQCIHQNIKCVGNNCNTNGGIVEATYEWADNPKY